MLPLPLRVVEGALSEVSFDDLPFVNPDAKLLACSHRGSHQSKTDAPAECG